MWQPPPTNLTCGKDEVHIWRASLDLPAPYLQRLRRTLTADEISRAKRFYFQRDHDHFVACRGLLRVILSRYLEVAPGEIRFRYGPYGKPEIVSPLRQQDLFFNLSHSHGLALYAIATNRRIGIDVEHIRLGVEIEAIAERFFSPSERAVIRALTGRQKREAFYNCWTRKEAFLKARGDGMTYPLNQFTVSLAPGDPAAILSTHGDPQEAARWSLRTLAVNPAYVAAVAAQGTGWRFICWEGQALEPSEQLVLNNCSALRRFGSRLRVKCAFLCEEPPLSQVLSQPSQGWLSNDKFCLEVGDVIRDPA